MFQIPFFVLSAIFILTGIAYLLMIRRLPFKGDFVLKSIPAFCLAILAFLYIPGATGTLMVAGFLFSAMGDISLCFEGEKYFLGGLGSFLVGHVLYIFAFAKNFTYSSGDLPLMLLWVAFAIGMAAVLFPKLGKMRLPVFIYIGVILTMVIYATGWEGLRPWFLLPGAVLFMLSDSMIAIDRFLKPISWSKYFIMVTYYVGQFLICCSFLSSDLEVLGPVR